MPSARSTPALLVVPAAVVTGHELGYALAGGGHGGHHPVDHGYLPALAATTLPLLVAALVWAAVSARRGRCHHRGGELPLPLAWLVWAQCGAFVAQELVEHALAGDAAGVVASAALWLGLVSQLAVAVAAWVLLATVSRAGGRALALLHPVSQWLPRGPRCPPRPVRRPPGSPILASLSSRGPPPHTC